MATAVTQTFQITNSGMNYVIDGTMNGALTLIRGKKYVLQVNAVGHPLYIQTSGGGYNASYVYTLGVSGNGVQVGNLVFDVSENAPDILYYQCQNHPGMYGSIYIVDPELPQSFIDIDPSSSTLEDLVDKTFYGLRQDRLTGQAFIDIIAGDEPIRLPNEYAITSDDYLNWMWSYNTFRYSFNAQTGRLLLEVY